MEQYNNIDELTKKLQALDEEKKTLYTRIDNFSKEEQKIIKQLYDMEKQERKRYKNYLKEFDESFETNARKTIQETPLLIALFREFIEQIYKPSKIYWMVSKIKKGINDKLTSNLNDEQKNLLEQWQECENRMSDDLLEQAFIYGYATAVSFREEAVKQYPPKIQDK